MMLRRGLAGIGVLVAVGLLQVAQRNAIWLRAYALGERLERAHREATDVSWLQARVIALASPGQLASAGEARHLDLVAWETLARQAPPGEAHEAAPVQVADSRDTAD